MHRHRHHAGACGRGGSRRRLSRDEWIARLEEHQRDLEQEIADVADLIRRLKDDREPAPATSV
jgi:hypothetical protein